MKTTVDTQWHGEEIKVQGKKVVNKSAFEVGLIVEGQAIDLCPVKTGRLKGSITTQADTGEGTRVRAPATSGDQISKPPAGEVWVGTNVEYGPFIEFGQLRKNAQPFLRPALDLAKGRVLTIVEANGRKEFKEYLQV